MMLNQYSWTDSLGYQWIAIQPPAWAEQMKADGYFCTFLKRVA